MVDLSPAHILRRLIDENPHRTTEWYRNEYFKIVADDQMLQKAIEREVLDEIGTEGVNMLMKPPFQRH